MIVEMTGGSAFDNTFGVYDPADETNYVELFGGSDEPGAQVLLSVLADGSITVNFNDAGTDFPSTWFGFYLDSSDTGGGIWYSDTALNSDGEDHMAVFQGTDTDWVVLPGFSPGPWTDNEFVLAFEEQTGSSSDWDYWDYTDMVLMVGSVTPIPEPATMLLFGSGLLGLACLGRRKFLK